jgi:biotin synthase
MNATIAEMGRRVLCSLPVRGGPGCEASRLGPDQGLSRPDLLELARLGAEHPWDIIHCAREVRFANFGDKVAFCSIVAGKSGSCSEDCKWCAQSAIDRHDAAPARKTAADHVLEAAGVAARINQAGCFCIVNSGRGPTQEDLAQVAHLSTVITASHSREGLRASASLGELNDEQARRLADAGVVRYNHNLETSRRFYGTLVSTHSYAQRLATLAAARRAGMKLCCGGIFGMGETWEDRIDLALTLRDQVGPDIVPLNFLMPLAGTALETRKPLEPLEILTIIALFRLALPRTDLKIAGGRNNLRDMQSWIFHAGATSCLVGNYLTACGRDINADLQMVKDLGLEVVREL